MDKKSCVVFAFIIFFLLSYSIAGYSYQGIPDDIPVSEGTEGGNDNSELRTVLEDYYDKKPNQGNYRRKGRLYLNKNDIRLEKDPKGEYFDLLIRKRPYVNSILITNYYWDHNKKRVREYGLRSLRFNWVNGNEKRLYKNMFIGKKQGLFFLVDSSPTEDKYFGEAFRIRLPKYVVYGYRKSSEVYGILRIKDGLKLNIRTFTRKYADYKGKYKDNPISLVLKDRPLAIKNHPSVTKIREVLEDNYNGVYVHYESQNQFFKSFLVREENERNFSEIGFNNESKEHKKAQLIAAYYKNGRGRVLEAVIYFRRDSVPKTYYITAVDKNGVHSVGRVVVKVPAINSDRGMNTSKPSRYDDSVDDNGEYWYNEGEF